MNQTFNPCDECDYRFSKWNQESRMCEICEFKKLLEEKSLQENERKGRMRLKSCKTPKEIVMDMIAECNYVLIVQRNLKRK